MAKSKPMEMAEAQQRALDILRRTPGTEEQARGVWKVIFEMIGDRAESATPKLKYYEVHHQREHARLAMLTAIAEGKNLTQADVAAREAVGLPVQIIQAGEVPVVRVRQRPPQPAS
ncbi:hypothetical protein [Paracoccus sp. MKU1]|uniref:hypothetical protein n=1 Tax=Paracoccus sp. MKU1 TaxID=1745182 RepID=UPI00071913E9|nr:hypothetical protein [Paracoccus sp. MKU1]